MGRKQQLKEVSDKIDRFLKGKDRKGVIIVSGGYAIGKSLFLKTILRKIQKVRKRCSDFV